MQNRAISALVGFYLAACTDGGGGGGRREVPRDAHPHDPDTSKRDSDQGGSHLYPAALYSGYDGKNKFQVPVMYLGDDRVQWSASDPAKVVLEPDSADSRKLMITTRSSGVVTITARSSRGSSSVTLTINSYRPEETAAGKSRFERGPNADNPACNSCHKPGGRGGDNTPTDIGRQTDETTAATYLSGRSPEGTITVVTHVWQVTDLERVGLMAYLRSQKPKGWPDPEEDQRQEDERED